MSHRRRLIGWAVGALMVGAGATALDAGAAPGPADGAGCRGLSPASSQGCTDDQLRAALDQQS